MADSSLMSSHGLWGLKNAKSVPVSRPAEISTEDRHRRRRQKSTNATCAPYQRRITDKRGGVTHRELLSYQLYEHSIYVERETMSVARTYVTRRSSAR